MNSIDNKGRDALRYLISSPGELEKFATEILSFLHENQKLLPLLRIFFENNYSETPETQEKLSESEVRRKLSSLINTTTELHETVEALRFLDLKYYKLIYYMEQKK